jgi:hypothetical protein
VPHGRHRVDGADPPFDAQSVQGVEIGAALRHRQRCDFQPKRLGPHRETRICERVGSDDVSRLQCRHDRRRQSVLAAIDDQDSVGTDGQPTLLQMPRHGGPLARATAMRLVAQQRFDVTRGRELSQGVTQHVGLPWQRRVVEAEVDRVRGH